MRVAALAAFKKPMDGSVDGSVDAMSGMSVGVNHLQTINLALVIADSIDRMPEHALVASRQPAAAVQGRVAQHSAVAMKHKGH